MVRSTFSVRISVVVAMIAASYYLAAPYAYAQEAGEPAAGATVEEPAEAAEGIAETEAMEEESEAAATEPADAASSEEEAEMEETASEESDEAAAEEASSDADAATEEPAEQEAVPEAEATEEADAEEADAEAEEAAEEDEEDEDEPDGMSDDEDADAEEDEAVEATSSSFMDLVRRFPEVGAVMHSAAVHLPIALWLFGALFVVIGCFLPSWRNQIPLACLIGGAIFAIPAVMTGWWVADRDGWNAWNDFDWDEDVVLHRWSAVSATAVSLVLSVVALVSQKKNSVLLGWIWRLGLIGLAVWVGWIGHLGGELIMGEGFLEDAVKAWLEEE